VCAALAATPNAAGLLAIHRQLYRPCRCDQRLRLNWLSCTALHFQYSDPVFPAQAFAYSPELANLPRSLAAPQLVPSCPFAYFREPAIIIVWQIIFPLLAQRPPIMPNSPAAIRMRA
jgi:hypothetical protein